MFVYNHLYVAALFLWISYYLDVSVEVFSHCCLQVTVLWCENPSLIMTLTLNPWTQL